MSASRFFFVLAMAAAQHVAAAGRLEIEHAWIRTAPPGAMMLAGYATLRNSGDAPVAIAGATSADFGEVSLHETVEENGVARMRALGEVTIAPGAQVVFAPGGKHLMLMRPTHAQKAGESIKIHFNTKSGDDATANFVVRDEAP
jgi:copper(I)-binding protein